jgi:Arc/MetJ-type ribon-helix-helix transcriptional regulator
MIIHLSKDLERFVHDAVRAGLYTNEDDVVRDALTRLEKTLPKLPRASGKAAPPKAKKTMTEEEFKQHLLEIGLVTSLPDPALDIDDDDEPPIVIKGEPLSETIIRERP